MIEVVEGERAPVATVVPIRGAGVVTGHLARYNIIKDHIKICLITVFDEEINIFKQKAIQNITILPFQ